MTYKQEINGEKGETRTKNMLLDHFILHLIIPDVEGRDFMVELRDGIIDSPQTNHAQVYTQAIIQAKFFEDNNQVLIRKEYVENEEGLKTEFFTFLHTDELNGKEACYFFSASEIRDTWRLSKRKSGKKTIDYYIFKLSKRREFEAYKNLTKNEICLRIEDAIRQTDEYRNYRNIQDIKDGFPNPTKDLFENINTQLFQRVKGKHIIDKLYICLNQYSDFRRIISWRLVDKISFYYTDKTSTYYNHFILHTNNKQIIEFFRSIEISSEVTIKDQVFFRGINGIEEKANRIVDILNNNLILNLKPAGESDSIEIRKSRIKHCECLDCEYGRLNFQTVNSKLLNKYDVSVDLWTIMQHAYFTFMLGNYENAKNLLSKIAKSASHKNEEILYFLSKYNLRTSLLRRWATTYPDLDAELRRLGISEEKKDILRSVLDNTLLNSYSRSIEEIYAKIKEYQQRKQVNNTANLIDRINAKLVECFNFYQGNWILIERSNEFDLMVEKVVESCLISYSMKSKYSCHLTILNDFIVELAVHHCESNNLLKYFQRNGIKDINYKSENDYFALSLYNFFKRENIDFLYPEISYFNNRVKNPDLRRNIKRIFENLCILLTYLDVRISSNELLKSITYFIKKLDFNIHEVSILAHPMFAKPDLFSTKEILSLINVILKKENYKDGYLLTNCLYCLEAKGFQYKVAQKNQVNALIKTAIEYPDNGLLEVLPQLLIVQDSSRLKDLISKTLSDNFSRNLYFESVKGGCLKNVEAYFNSYLEFFRSISDDAKKAHLFSVPSRYTGISEPYRRNLNNLVELVYHLNYFDLRDNSIINQIRNFHPYYNFILDIESNTIDESFDLNWLLENQSEIILLKLSKKTRLKAYLKKELKNECHKELGEIYFKYFSE